MERNTNTQQTELGSRFHKRKYEKKSKDFRTE